MKPAIGEELRAITEVSEREAAVTENGLPSVPKKTNGILEGGRRLVNWFRSHFSGRAKEIVAAPVQPKPVPAVPAVPAGQSLADKLIAARKAMAKPPEGKTQQPKKTDIAPLVGQVLKLNGGISTEWRETYETHKRELLGDIAIPGSGRADTREIASMVREHRFIFDVLEHVLKYLIANGKHYPDFIKKLVKLEIEPVPERATKLMFVLRNTILGNVVPTQKEIRDIRAVLFDSEVFLKTETEIRVGKNGNCHPRIQRLRKEGVEHPVMQRLLNDNSDEKESMPIVTTALRDIFVQFRLYFPRKFFPEDSPEWPKESMFEPDYELPAVPEAPAAEAAAEESLDFVAEKIPETSAAIVEKTVEKPAAVAARKPQVAAPAKTVPDTERQSSVYNLGAIVEAKKDHNVNFWDSLAMGQTGEFPFPFSVNAYYEMIEKKAKGPGIPYVFGTVRKYTYSVEKLSQDEYVTRMIEKKAFQNLLFRLFRKAPLKAFNDAPDVRIPAAVLIDLLQGDKISDAEAKLVSDVLAHTDFAPMLDAELARLKANKNIREFNILKSPCVKAGMVTGGILSALANRTNSQEQQREAA
jgi:hypothetical protein